MDDGVIALALALNLAAAMLFYWAAPRQRWLAQALPARPARALAGAALAGALALWMWQAEIATALFAVLTVTMVLFALLPYLAAALVTASATPLAAPATQSATQSAMQATTQAVTLSTARATDSADRSGP